MIYGNLITLSFLYRFVSRIVISLHFFRIFPEIEAKLLTDVIFNKITAGHQQRPASHDPPKVRLWRTVSAITT